MDISNIAAAPIAGASSQTGVVASVDLSVLNSVQQLQGVLVNELFSSLGLGATIDAYA